MKNGTETRGGAPRVRFFFLGRPVDVIVARWLR
jgi:hypothetical protein